MTKEYANRIVSKLALNEEIEALKKNDIDEKENLNVAGIQQTLEGNFSYAGVLFREEINHNPKMHETHNNLGHLFYLKKDFTNAIIYFQNSIMLSPGSAKTYLNLASVLEIFGNQLSARDYYQKTLEISSEIYQAYLGLARIATSRKQWEEAKECISSALKIDSENPKILYQAGLLYSGMGNMTVAVKYLDKAKNYRKTISNLNETKNK